MTIPKKGITADRKSVDKLEFIKSNYEKLTRAELAEKINESPRWVKRQISLLKNSGVLVNKRSDVREARSIDDWPPGVKDRVIFLYCEKLLSASKICPILLEEFNFDIGQASLGVALRKFGLRRITKEEWLKDNVTHDLADKLLCDGLRMVDVRKYLNDTFSVDISDDYLLEYFNRIGLSGQRIRSTEVARGRIAAVSREWINEQLSGHVPTKEISKKIGVSTTLLARRIDQEGLEVLKHRKQWSQSLEEIRDCLNAEPIKVLNISEEDKHQMILGWLAGDGHLDLTGRFTVNHSLKQLSYLYVKFHVLRDKVQNVVTVPAHHFQKGGEILGGSEQLGISCPGMGEYQEYMNGDGSKNFDKIYKDMNSLGWACYYMDDGSYFGGCTIISMRTSMVKEMENRYSFGLVHAPTKHAIIVKDICSLYILPGMTNKLNLPESGEYWKPFFPELFKPTIENDLHLSFVDPTNSLKFPEVLNSSVEYYHKKGFPGINLSDDYLRKEWERIGLLNTEFIWKTDDSIRYAEVGNPIFKHFMPHMVEAKYRGTSPKEVFDGYMSLRSSLEYCLKIKKSILPIYLRDCLIYFNGGVSGFPCSVAKALSDKFCPTGGIVVDPCAGWGGRMLGVSSTGRKYVSFEPWSKTYEGLLKIRDRFDIQGVTLYNNDFDIGSCPTLCDFIMTSPPYMDLEVYGYKRDTSHWVKLMADIFAYAEKSLKPGGYLALNIPRSLKVMLPQSALEEGTPVYWHSSSRKRLVDNAEIVYLWCKVK